jgi:hypothetical protein
MKDGRAGGKDVRGDKIFSGVRCRMVSYRRTRLCKDQNRPGGFERRPERSRGSVGAAGGGIGRDSASSAQLKCIGGVGLNGGLMRGGGNKTAQSGVHWDWHRCTGRDGGVASKLGVLVGDDSIISDGAGV